jgi:2-succinyl-5-enolpyruvyl-6-hydroxy-3-cyclohexene-1-carboxylate synthase
VRNLQDERARLLIASLADAGVTDAGLSPGSRSTPFVLAAARHGALRCFDVVDERSAAYFALGQARVTGRPTLLICTDLSGLWAARHVTTPFALVVVQNRGGRIFEMLPLADHPASRGEVFDHWLTPHVYDLAHAAALFGLPFARASTRGALAEALRETLGRPGVTVIEAVVPPSGAAEQNRRLGERLRESATGGTG